ncbi:unnamed protein product [Moneuplotes crassus]|uniref:Potassium channel domain-containing protein n=1 Tax=Euplotes crassus TaxID=5936 RepID=A0AAD1X377_EUPCR|nr:unnamed protein product [Moneuplotes crassus]
MESDSYKDKDPFDASIHDSFEGNSKILNFTNRFDTMDNFLGTTKNLFLMEDSQFYGDLQISKPKENAKQQEEKLEEAKQDDPCQGIEKQLGDNWFIKDTGLTTPQRKKLHKQETLNLMKKRNHLAHVFVKNMSSKLNDLKVSQYGSAKMIDNELDKYRYIVYAISFLAILGVAICAIEQELYIRHGKGNYTLDRVLLLSCNLFITFLVSILTAFSYYQGVFIKRAEGVLLTIDSLQKEQLIWLILEIILNFIHPMPFLCNTTFNEQVYPLNISLPKRVDTVLFIAMVHIRAYHLCRPFLLSSDYMTNRAYRVCNISRTDCSYWFAIRSVFKAYTASVTVLLFIFCTIFYGALLRFNEGAAHVYSEKVQNFNWRNSLWCSYITMTTVGYGDFYPVTFYGCCSGVLCSLAGSLIQSLAVIALFEILDFQPSEDFSYNLLKFLEKKDKLLYRATRMMISMFRFNKYKIKKYLVRYSNRSWLFSKSSTNLRISYMSRLTKGDYMRRDIKSLKRKTQNICKMIEAIKNHDEKYTKFDNDFIPSSRTKLLIPSSKVFQEPKTLAQLLDKEEDSLVEKKLNSITGIIYQKLNSVISVNQFHPCKPVINFTCMVYIISKRVILATSICANIQHSLGISLFCYILMEYPNWKYLFSSYFLSRS